MVKAGIIGQGLLSCDIKGQATRSRQNATRLLVRTLIEAFSIGMEFPPPPLPPSTIPLSLTFTLSPLPTFNNNEKAI